MVFTLSANDKNGLMASIIKDGNQERRLKNCWIALFELELPFMKRMKEPRLLTQLTASHMKSSLS